MCIVSEDTYGYIFLRKIIYRLKDCCKAPDLEVYNTGSSYNTYRGSHYDKLVRIVRVLCPFCDIILITKDADGRNIHEEEDKLKNLINNCEKVKFLIFNYQIEDWIVYSLTKHLDPNPAEYLKTHYQYEKYKLDDYADKLKFEILKNLDSFYKFIQYIKLEKCFS